MNTVIIGIIVLVVLIVIIAFFTGGTGTVINKIKGIFGGATATDYESAVKQCENYYDAAKKRDEIRIGAINWIGEKPLTDQFDVKLRHGPEMVSAKLTEADEGGIIKLSKNDQGIAPGQFVVNSKTCT